VCTSAAYILFYRRRPLDKKAVSDKENPKSGVSTNESGKMSEEDEAYIYALD
jgi:hypothetical protein